MNSSTVTSARTATKSASPIRIVYQALGNLAPDPKNPRKHSPRQVKQIARSIERFGFLIPIIVDSAGRTIAGHGRLLGAQRLGMTEVPTICVDHLTPEEIRAFQIADNKLTENSVWDDTLLATNLKDLAAVVDFDLEITGFDGPEIDLRIESLDVDGGSEDAADQLPPRGPAVSQIGDLWVLGRHRVLCGNALEATAHATLLDGQLASAVFTDVPYNVAIDGHVCGNGAIKHGEFKMASGEMSVAEYTTFLRKAFALLAANSEDGSIHFQCIDWRHVREMLAAGHEVYSELKNICVWAKSTAGMGSFYRSQHEMILVWKRGAASHRNNIQLGKFGRNRSNIWAYPSPSSFGRTSEEGTLLALHPTVKPTALVADAILDCSERGDIVLDSFLGSGTTVIAAERTGRRCYGIELDPLYVDTVVRRWQAYTGGQAVHAKSGRTFNQVAEEQGQSHAEAAQ